MAELFRVLNLKSGGPWFKSSTLLLSGFVLGSPEFTTVFIDTRLWKVKHPRKRFQNFRQSWVLSTDRIDIH